MEFKPEKQWSIYLQNKENRDSLKDERHAKVEETKREMIKLKKKTTFIERERIRESKRNCSKRIEKPTGILKL